MDWQFKVGLGVTVIFGLLPFLVKIMPNWVTWPGIFIGLLFIIWGLLPNNQNIPKGPALLFIIACAGIVCSIAWYKTLLKESNIPSKLIVAVHDFHYNDNGHLTMKISFSNNSDKQCIITNIQPYAVINNRSIELLPNRLQKTNLPNKLMPKELWLYEMKENFNFNSFIHNNNLQGIITIPISVSISVIGTKGRELGIHFRFAEIQPGDKVAVPSTNMWPEQHELILE